MRAVFRRRPRRSPQTYVACAVVFAAVAVLDIVSGLGAIYTVVLFACSAWSLRLAWRAR
jgi:hypothetical protein